MKEEQVPPDAAAAAALQASADHSNRNHADSSRKLPSQEEAGASVTSAWSAEAWHANLLAIGDEDLIATAATVIRSAPSTFQSPDDAVSAFKTTMTASVSRRQPRAGQLLHCPRTWDGWSCWKENVAVGVTVEQPCPDHIYWKIAAPPCRGKRFPHDSRFLPDSHSLDKP